MSQMKLLIFFPFHMVVKCFGNLSSSHCLIVLKHLMLAIVIFPFLEAC